MTHLLSKPSNPKNVTFTPTLRQYHFAKILDLSEKITHIWRFTVKVSKSLHLTKPRKSAFHCNVIYKLSPEFPKRYQSFLFKFLENEKAFMGTLNPEYLLRNTLSESKNENFGG